MSLFLDSRDKLITCLKKFSERSKRKNKTRVEVPDSCPDFEGRAASGLRPKLQSHAESLSLESMDKSRAVVRGSLIIPKFDRESLDMGRESLQIDEKS